MKNQIYNLSCLIAISFASLFAGCSTSNPSVAKRASELTSKAAPANTSADGYFLPKGTFKGPDQPKPMILASSVARGEDSTRRILGDAVGLSPMVWLYASPTSKTYYAASSIDFKDSLRLWEVFLKKYKIPYKVVLAVDKLEASAPGVLVLPSLIALSEREKLAIIKFRSQGGSVLSSWLTGVRDEKGHWQGFSFMRDSIGAMVLGDTEDEQEENFIMPHGDGAITHSLPAGQRVWFERVKGIYPLRLSGQQPAAQIMNWSRTTLRNKPGTTIVFGEQRQPSGVLSRSVTLGYPERLWLATDPMAIEAIAHNALTWLLRQPDIYLAAWPFPYSGALSIAVDSGEVVDDVDITFAESIENTGARATYYVLSGNAKESAGALKKLQAKGHELGYMGDRFAGFQDQPAATQSKRLTLMRQEFKDAALSTGVDSGFHAPMESQDKTTLELVNQLGFAYAVAFMDVTDARIPMVVPRSGGQSIIQKPLVILPRTQSGPEDLMDEGDPEDGLKQYLAEFESSVAMGGLSLVRFRNQSLLTDAQAQAVFEQIKRHSDRLWIAPNGAVARWWLDRDRISVEVNAIDGRPKLTVIISPGPPLTQAAAVIVNVPYANDALKLVPLGRGKSEIKVRSLDPWRTAVSLDGLPPGTHRWVLQFGRAGT
jgi:hypothetical protein